MPALANDTLVIERDELILGYVREGLSSNSIARKLKKEPKFIPVKTTQTVIRQVIRSRRRCKIGT